MPVPLGPCIRSNGWSRAPTSTSVVCGPLPVELTPLPFRARAVTPSRRFSRISRLHRITPRIPPPRHTLVPSACSKKGTHDLHPEPWFRAVRTPDHGRRPARPSASGGTGARVHQPVRLRLRSGALPLRGVHSAGRRLCSAPGAGPAGGRWRVPPLRRRHGRTQADLDALRAPPPRPRPAGAAGTRTGGGRTRLLPDPSDHRTAPARGQGPLSGRRIPPALRSADPESIGPLPFEKHLETPTP